MKRVITLAVIAILLAGCGTNMQKYENIYKHGTVAKYNVFQNDVFIGYATYTFTYEKYKETDTLKIARYSETRNKTANLVDDSVTATSVVYIDVKTYKPLYSNARLDWKGKTEGWHETETDYGDMMAKWNNKTPAGSTSKEIKFRETFYDEDEMAWIVPLLGYKDDNRIYFTAFANRSGQPTQGLIWTGSRKNMEAGGKKYEVFAASARLNEYNQNLWFDITNGRLVEYMQTEGFMGYIGNPKNVPEDYEPPQTKYVEVLESWTEPKN